MTAYRLKDERLAQLIASISLNESDLVLSHIRVALCELQERRKEVEELERGESKLIDERDSAETALADMYKSVMGNSPEWSNWFGFADAVEEVELVCDIWREISSKAFAASERITNWSNLCPDNFPATPASRDLIGGCHWLDWNQLSALGLIVRINKEILHPMGLALFRDPESGVSDGALIAPDGKWHYADDIEKGGAK
ncbi:hypothetical protein K6S25_001998 [Salmonella enterica]|nr:hypothetical protein [Salmonella enterica]EHZ8551851.1 hypothetical protein [Salmonella enterica]